LRVCARPHREALIQAARSLGSDAAGIVAKSTEIEFIEARKGSFPSVYESLAAFCNARVSKAILGQEMTSEPGGRGLGSYALGRVHLEVRQDIVEADCKAPAKTITRQILRPLIGFNFGSDEPIPRACITRMIWNY
jgi:phage gp29-like protein